MDQVPFNPTRNIGDWESIFAASIGIFSFVEKLGVARNDDEGPLIALRQALTEDSIPAVEMIRAIYMTVSCARLAYL